MHRILCVGEILWDNLPQGMFLGGAPFNVSCHLRELGRPVAFASRIGNDERGQEILRYFERNGLLTNLLQNDSRLPTGMVNVKLDAHGSPTFKIASPAAWDMIEARPELVFLASRAAAIVFGSLAQRSQISRQTIQTLLANKTYKVFDVNLRLPFDSKEVVEESLRRSHLVKMNKEEFQRLADWFGLPSTHQKGAIALCQKFNCSTVCITRGAKGACLWHKDRWFEHPGFKVKVTDAVGAGDAFLAALLDGLLAGANAYETLIRANAIGAYVATQPGATPTLVFDEIARMIEPSAPQFALAKPIEMLRPARQTSDRLRILVRKARRRKEGGILPKKSAAELFMDKPAIISMKAHRAA
ncbi:MAG: carbohydrate kinase [Candidatus Sumerlaeota bacterium]|nr:carbohydrate kinase [Candidatus Sumerlaeota bacterium]